MTVSARRASSKRAAMQSSLCGPCLECSTAAGCERDQRFVVLDVECVCGLFSLWNGLSWVWNDDGGRLDACGWVGVGGVGGWVGERTEAEIVRVLSKRKREGRKKERGRERAKKPGRKRRVTHVVSTRPHVGPTSRSTMYCFHV